MWRRPRMVAHGLGRRRPGGGDKAARRQAVGDTLLRVEATCSRACHMCCAGLLNLDPWLLGQRRFLSEDREQSGPDLGLGGARALDGWRLASRPWHTMLHNLQGGRQVCTCASRLLALINSQ
ncbi:hypothetical protein BDA96_06G059300 [Sorghum bicolor]|uniref:Uncharacterized protein n=2 Tax=Sorghum bicolor TaxID=4558 RepID=A0A921QNQ9_SORBI|nr:hypothetical protein BDA96_06G059300 [Sorghum bicolor]OQU81404.1 hypothetical protein SORBI_3006G052900 [Sorghum bicolor]